MKIIMLTVFILYFKVAFTATLPHPGYIILKESNEIFIDKNSNVYKTRYIKYKILSEEGLKIFNIYKIKFDSQLEEVEIESANVINEQIERKIDLKSNLNRRTTLPTSTNGLTNSTQIEIAIPNLELNSVIEIKLKHKNKNKLIKNFYSEKFEFGTDTYIGEYELTVNSEIPFYYKTNFPSQNFIKITENNKTKPYKLIVNANYDNLLVNFNFNSLTIQPNSEKYYTLVSTSNDWNLFRESLSKIYYSQLNTPLPKELSPIIENLRHEQSDDKKILKSLEYITSKYRYLGDWRTDYGLIAPKSITKTFSDKFGDCKDFSNLLIRLLKELNIPADFALVERSLIPNSYVEKNLVYSQTFNHVIVRINLKNKTYWIDPTNLKAVNLIARNDILNKTALNLNLALPIFENISSSKEDIISKFTASYNIENSNLKANLNAIIVGEASRIMTDELSIQNRASIDSFFQQIIPDQREKKIILEELPNFQKQSYENISFKYNYSVIPELSFNIENRSYNIQTRYINPLPLFDPETITNSVYLLSTLMNYEFVEKYLNMYLVDETPKNCELELNGMFFSRKTRLLEKGFEIITKFHTSKEFIDHYILKSQIYNNFINAINDCNGEEILKVTLDEKEHKTKSQIFNRQISKLPSTERIKLRLKEAENSINFRGNILDFKNSRNYIEELLESNLEEDTKNVDTLIFLSMLYLYKSYQQDNDYEQSTLQKSISLSERALSINPNSKLGIIHRANLYRVSNQEKMGARLFKESFHSLQPENLNKQELLSTAYYLYQSGKIAIAQKYSDFALASKLLNEKEKSLIYFYIGIYYLNQNDNEKCIQNFEKSISLNPRNIWNYQNIINCTSNSKQPEKTIKYATKALALTGREDFKDEIFNAKTMIAYDFLQKDDLANAELNANEGLKAKNQRDALTLLALISIKKNEIAKANNYIQKAIANEEEYDYEDASNDLILKSPKTIENKVINFIIQNFPNNHSFNKRSAIVVDLINEYLKKGKNELAIFTYNSYYETLQYQKNKSITKDDKENIILNILEVIKAKYSSYPDQKDLNNFKLLSNELMSLSPSKNSIRKLKELSITQNN